MGRSGHNQDKPAFTLFSFASGLFVQPINFHYKDQMQRSLVLDCFFSEKKGHNPKFVKRKWKIEKNNSRKRYKQKQKQGRTFQGILQVAV